MGIAGLLPFLESATRTCNISEFRGATVAVDSYCWLHRGAIGCANILARGDDTDTYVKFCMKYLNMLTSYGIKPIMVFDGNHLPAKAITEKRRRETRNQAKARAAELLRLGKTNEAWNYLRQAIDVTPEMALKLIQECRANNIDCIVAPYESDSQLAYLNLKGIADIVITEDSDLLVFGCTKVIFKLDLNGNGRLVDNEKLPLCMNMKPDVYTFDKFRYMCILSGCDYLDSLPGVGLKKALKFVSLTAESDPVKFLQKVPKYLNLKNVEVSSEYIENFLIAVATFRHQIVFDPVERKLTHLTDPGLSGTRPQYCINAGHFFDDETAYQLAVGNLNPFTLEKLDDWTPRHNSNIGSIWSENYVKKPTKTTDKREPMTISSFEQQKNKTIVLKRHDKTESKENIEDNRVDELENQLTVYFEKTGPPEEVKTEEEEKVSPVLRKTINPFAKQRLSKFNLTEIDDKVVVKSKYFNSSSVEATDCNKEDDDRDAKKQKSDENVEKSLRHPLGKCRQVGLSSKKKQSTLKSFFTVNN